MRKVIKWGSVACIALGVIAGGIGILMGGLDATNFMFWM